MTLLAPTTRFRAAEMHRTGMYERRSTAAQLIHDWPRTIALASCVAVIQTAVLILRAVHG